jgi:hypothetical protein
VRALATLLKWLILLPILAAILLIAVANGEDVTVHLNPFDGDDPVLRAILPLYQLAFILFALGVLVGGLVAWASGLRRRRRERTRGDAPYPSRAHGAPGRTPNTSPVAADVAGFLPGPRHG